MTDHILLVGASSGIGLEVARGLHADGARVTAVSRTRGELPDAVAWHPADITDPEAGLPEVEGPLAGLVYLPGTINLRPFARLKLDDFREDLEVNYLGAVRAVQAYLPNLKARPNSAIVLMSTVAVRQGMGFHASIAGAKGAVEGLGRSLAAELAPGVRVNLVAPSLTDTPLAGRLLGDEARREAAAGRHPLGRVGSAADVAGAVRYLLSDAAGWVTGQVIPVDGGLGSLRVW